MGEQTLVLDETSGSRYNLMKILYSQVLLKRGLIYHDIRYDTAIAVAESE